MSEPGTSLSTLDDYERAGNVNVLRPVISIDRVPEAQSPYLAETVQVIQIVPEVDTYHDFRYANERAGLHALSGLGLAKIAAAAGVKWVPEECRIEERERRSDGHVYVRYRAAGAIRQPNGEWHLEIATRDIDTADEEEDIRAAYRRRRDSPRGKPMTDAQIEEAVQRDVLQLRKFVLAQAETKAKNRVIRRILALRQVYTAAELKRPFAVPRLVYRPDIAEANLRLERHGPVGEITAGEDVDERPIVDETAGSEADVSQETRTTEKPAEEGNRESRSKPPPPVPSSDETSSEDTQTGAEHPASSTGGEPIAQEDGSASSAPSSEDSSPDELEPTEGEVWTPNTILPPDPPKVDPELPGGGRFSELAGTTEGVKALEEIATNSKAKARREAAQAWLDYARAVSS